MLMENTCVLTSLPVIPNWKIYNSVPKKPVKYCAILREKRDFQILLENVVFSKILKSSCSIIDRRIDASKDKSNLSIVFLNIEEKDLLSLNLTVTKKHALRQRNNLLIFLKNNANYLKYQIQDGSVYVKCDANIQWHLFYNLFEFLLVRYGICNIGALFYCVLFSNWMLKQEIRFLCYNPMDSKCTSYSLLLNLHQITTNKNVNNTCKKMPKRALCSQNDFGDGFILTDSQDLTLKILSDSIPTKNALDKDSTSNCMMPKRKILKLDCSCAELRCKCHESKWKLHKNISKYNVNCYMDILLKKGVTSTDELSIAQGDSTFGNFSSQNFESLLNNIVENSAPCLELLATKKNELPLSESQNGEKYSPNHLPGEQSEMFTRDAVHVVTDSVARSELKPKPESLLKAINLLTEDMGAKEDFSFLLDEFSEKKKYGSATTAFNKCKSVSGKKEEFEFSEKETFHTTTAAFNMFQTASGKKEEFGEFSEKVTFHTTTAAFNMFQTASGKKVNVSEKALKAAEQMFTEVMQSNDDSFSVNKNTNDVLTEKNFDSKRVALSSANENLPEIEKDKQLNESIDGMLEDNFFEDICFDEKEDSTDATQSSSAYANRCEKSSSVGKVRKSLGGRRSLKPYSVPKT